MMIRPVSLKHRATSGFTLIEALIYIALFTVVVGGGILTAVQLLESSANTRQRTAVEAEGNFIMRKLDWAITGSDITLPTSGATSTTLSLSRDGTTYDFTLSGNTLMLATDGAAATPLNTLSAPMSGLVFRHIAGSPEGIEFTFFLNNKQFGPKARYLR